MDDVQTPLAQAPQQTSVHRQDSIDEATPPANRIIALDALRGLALLGILAVNMRFFSLPDAAAPIRFIRQRLVSKE